MAEGSGGAFYASLPTDRQASDHYGAARATIANLTPEQIGPYFAALESVISQIGPKARIETPFYFAPETPPEIRQQRASEILAALVTKFPAARFIPEIYTIDNEGNSKLDIESGNKLSQALNLPADQRPSWWKDRIRAVGDFWSQPRTVALLKRWVPIGRAAVSGLAALTLGHLKLIHVTGAALAAGIADLGLLMGYDLTYPKIQRPLLDYLENFGHQPRPGENNLPVEKNPMRKVKRYVIHSILIGLGKPLLDKWLKHFNDPEHVGTPDGSYSWHLFLMNVLGEPIFMAADHNNKIAHQRGHISDKSTTSSYIVLGAMETMSYVLLAMQQPHLAFPLLGAAWLGYGAMTAMGMALPAKNDRIVFVDKPIAEKDSEPKKAIDEKEALDVPYWSIHSPEEATQAANEIKAKKPLIRTARKQFMSSLLCPFRSLAPRKTAWPEGDFLEPL